VEKEFDLAEGEAHVAGEANEERAVEGVARITPLTPVRRRGASRPIFFVVAEGGGVETGAGGEFPDFHFSLPGISLDLKLTLTFSIWDGTWQILFGGRHERKEESFCRSGKAKRGEMGCGFVPCERWSYGAAGTDLGSRSEAGKAGDNDAKQVLLQHQSAHARGAVAAKAIGDKQVAARKEIVETARATNSSSARQTFRC